MQDGLDMEGCNGCDGCGRGHPAAQFPTLVSQSLGKVETPEKVASTCARDPRILTAEFPQVSLPANA